MPEFIESVYVHRPVREADIPRRDAQSKRARGKGKRARKTAASPATTAAMSPPPTLWSIAAREAMFRPMPRERRGRLSGINLTPLGWTVFFVWILVCCVYKIWG